MRGQLTLIAFIAALLDLLILAVLAPIFNTATNLIIAGLDPTDTVDIFLCRLIFPVLVFGVIFTALSYYNPFQQKNPYQQ